MNCLLVLCIVACAYSVQGFALKRSKDSCNACFAHMAGEITEFYFQEEDAGNMVKDAMRECLAKEGEEEACLKGRRAKFAEVYGEEGAQGVEAILEGLFHVGAAVWTHCADKDKDSLKECAGKVLQYIKDSEDCDAECDQFIDLFGEKGAECEELKMKNGPKERSEENTEAKRILRQLNRLASLRVNNYKK